MGKKSKNITKAWEKYEVIVEHRVYGDPYREIQLEDKGLNVGVPLEQ